MQTGSEFRQLQHRRSLYDTEFKEAVFVSLCVHGQRVDQTDFGPSGVSIGHTRP